MSNQLEKRTEDTREEAALQPVVDVVEDANGITLYADMPGVPKDKLEIRVEGENLILEGALAITLAEGLEASHVEVEVPRYRRVFTLSKELDGEKVSADYQQGVLKLRIPKAEHAQPRKIAVQVA